MIWRPITCKMQPQLFCVKSTKCFAFFQVINSSLLFLLIMASESVKRYHGCNFWIVANVRFIFSSANRDTDNQTCCTLWNLTTQSKRQCPIFSSHTLFFFSFQLFGGKELSPLLLVMDVTQLKKKWDIQSEAARNDSHCITDEGVKVIKTRFMWGYKLLRFSTNDLL